MECGPSGVPGFLTFSAQRWSHCVQDSITFPLASTTTMQFRASGLGTDKARSPKKPQNPGKFAGTLAGSFSSPRTARYTRFCDSANTDACDPQMYPCRAHGRGQFGTTVYSPVMLLSLDCGDAGIAKT